MTMMIQLMDGMLGRRHIREASGDNENHMYGNLTRGLDIEVLNEFKTFLVNFQ